MSATGEFVSDIKEIRRRARQHLSEGAVTQNYGCNAEDAVAMLNHAVATEIVCILRYKFHAVCATGIASEAVKALTAYAIRQFRLSRVFAITFEWNPASARVLEKAGFTLEGRLRRSAIKDGQVVDQRQYAYIVPDRDTAQGGAP